MKRCEFFLILITTLLSGFSVFAHYDREYLAQRTAGSPFHAVLSFRGTDAQTSGSSGPVQLNSNGNCQLNLNNCTVGINVIDVIIGLFRTVKNAMTASKVTAAFIDKYSRWQKEDYRNDIIEQFRTANPTGFYSSYQDARSWNGYIPDSAQNNILSTYEQYQFSEFRDWIKTFSQYESYIIQLYQRVNIEQANAPGWFKKVTGLRKGPFWEDYPGFDMQSFPDIVTQLHTDVQREIARREKEAWERELREQKRVVAQQCINHDLAAIRDTIYEHTHNPAADTVSERVVVRWHARERALEQSEQENHRVEIVEYRFSRQVADLLRDACINSRMFENFDSAGLQESITRRVSTLDGSRIQHCLQQEVMSILEQAATARYAQVQNQSVKLFTDTIGGMAHVATEFNQKGDIKNTMLLADFCWAVLDVGMGVCEGAIDGVSSVAHMIVHPVDTVTNTAHGVATAAYCTSRVLYEICGITKDCLIDFDMGQDRINRAYVNIKAVTAELGHKISTMTPRQIARAATGVLVEVALTKKCMTTMHRFYQGAQVQIAVAVRKIEQGMHPKLAFAGAGYEFTLAAEATDSLLMMGEGEGVLRSAEKSVNAGRKVLKKRDKSEKILKKCVVKNKSFLEINHPVIDNIRTGSALKLDSYHAFNDIIDNYARYAQKSTIKGADSIERALYQIEGSLNGEKGIFEWIVDKRPEFGVTHRLFIKNGKITGRPNMFPSAI